MNHFKRSSKENLPCSISALSLPIKFQSFVSLIGIFIISCSLNLSWSQSLHPSSSSQTESKYHPLKIIDQASTLLDQLAKGNPNLPSPSWQDVYIHWKTLFHNGQHTQLLKEINLIFGSLSREEWIALLNYLETNLDKSLDPILASILIALPILYPHDLWWIPIVAKLVYHNREVISETSLWLFESGYVKSKDVSQKTVSWVEKQFDTQSENVKIKTIYLWSLIASHSEKAWHIVIQSLQDHSPRVRKAAVDALVKLKSDIVRWLPKILPLLKEGQKEAIESFQALRSHLAQSQFNLDPYLKKIKWLLPHWLKAELWPSVEAQKAQTQ